MCYVYVCIHVFLCIILSVLYMYMYIYISMYIYIYIHLYICLTYYNTECVHSVFSIKTNLCHVQCTVCVYAKCALNYRAVPAKNALE